jgi:hypothetical protein
MHRLLITVLIAALGAQAGADEARNDLAIGVGYANSNLSPEHGVPLVLRYARWIGGAAVVVRGELASNAERPDGQLMKGASVALDVGLELRRGPIAVGLLVGPCATANPGYGAEARLSLAVRQPLSARLWIGAELDGVAGVMRYGDENPQTKMLTSGELVLMVGSMF